MTLTLALVDDHHVFREGLRAVLSTQPDLCVVGEAEDARRAFSVIDDKKPNIVVVDLTLPDGDGIATTREILRRKPRTRVLILTMHTNEFFVTQAFSAGAAGFALKSQRPDEIVDAVRTVGRGETYICPQFAALLTQERQVQKKPGSGGPFDDLSRREREIFGLILRGFTNQAIGETLCISVKTVETHRAHINKKLRVHSTGELIRLAALHGLVAT